MRKRENSFFSGKKLYNDLVSKQCSDDALTVRQTEQLHTVLLDMYRDLREGCEKYGVYLTLVGGSALGQERHGGFIPWDDDMDTALSRAEYQKFFEIFDREFSDRYILVAPNSQNRAINRFAQVFKKGTSCRKFADPEEMPNMIYLDIFQVDYAPQNPFMRKLKGIWCTLLMAIAGQVFFKETLTHEKKAMLRSSFRGRVNLALKWIAGAFFGCLPASSWFNKVDQSLIHPQKTDYMTVATGRKHYFGELLPADVFYPVREAMFQGEKCYICQNQRAYLENLYGKDYMQIPPEEERENHHFRELSFGGEVQ